MFLRITNKKNNLLYCLIYFLFFYNFLYSQNLNSDIINYPVKSNRTTGIFKVLAVMVQFKQDRDTLTTGDGTFDLSNKYKDTIVDAPPHDRQYFLSHLKFLKNYYYKVSDGKVNIEYFIPDKIYTLPDSMRRYGSAKNNDYSKLAELASDVWKLVDKESPEIDFSKYDCFFIFHAGIGKDVDLASIYGADPTPYDLPSITFNIRSFKKYFGDSFEGIPVNNGQYSITNTAILPEAEYREIKSYGTTSLVELSINGLIVSSFGSFLGLPDLFNTKNGKTAIGRFGLMDSQSIFSYNGIFPPEPSAWEKVYLGWVSPITIYSGEHTINISSHRTDGLFANSQIYKFPISNKEYFLLECRYRDPANDGLKIITEVRGVQKEYHIPKDTSNFNQFGNISLIDGVVIDVDDIDWSLPGGFDYKKNKLYGGILIWHIDENKIEAGLADNTINNNPEHKGVDLEEADGSQDIGQEYGMLQSGAGSENGTALDFWYNDLNYYSKDSLVRPVYKNIFSYNSNPNSLSYYGAKSNITIYDFSEQSPNMSFKVRIGSDNISLLNGFPIKLTDDNSIIKITNANLLNDIIDFFIITINDSLKIIDTKGKLVVQDYLYLVKSFAILKENNKQDKIALVRYENGNFLEVYSINNNTLSKMFSHKLSTFERDSFFVYTLLSDANTNSRIEVLNKSNGIISHFYLQGNNIIFLSNDTINNLKPVKTIIGYENFLKINNLDYFSISENSIYTNKNLLAKYNMSDNLSNLIINQNDLQGSINLAYLYHNTTENKLSLRYIPLIKSINQGQNSNNTSNINENSRLLFPNFCNECWKNISQVVSGDIDCDKQSDFLFTVYDKLYAFSNSGVSLDYFPITFNASVNTVKPIIADINGDSKNEVIVLSQDGNIYAYNSKGKLLDNYPVTIGSKPIVTPIFFRINDSLGLAVIDSKGYLYAYKLGNRYNSNSIISSGDYTNERMSGYQYEKFDIFISKSNDYMPKERAYNYPNPVYGNYTKIRYYLSENSNVKIRIFDLSGEKVHEFNTHGIGGMDNEVVWDVSKIQSGVYIANIEAISEKNKSSVNIKIAVIK